MIVISSMSVPQDPLKIGRVNIKNAQKRLIQKYTE